MNADIRRKVALARRNILNYETAIDRDLAFSLSEPSNWTHKPTISDYIAEGRACGRRLKFCHQVDAVLAREPRRNRFVPVAMSPTECMLKVGFPDLPILMTPVHVANITQQYDYDLHHHDVDPVEFKRLPECLERPLAIFEQPDRMSAIIMLLEMKTRYGAPIFCPIDPFAAKSKTETRYPSNFLLSAYGRRQISYDLDEAYDAGTLLYIDSTRVKGFLTDLYMKPPERACGVDGFIHESEVAAEHSDIYYKALSDQLKSELRGVDDVARDSGAAALRYQCLEIREESFNAGIDF